MAETPKKIKKIQLGGETYDLAVNGIDKVEGLQEELDSLKAEHQMHTVDGNVLVIGEEPDNSLTATTTLKQVQVGNALYNIKDTTYESKSAVSSGTEVSLVTTGEKYTWNTHVNSAHAPANAEKNVQADWSVTDTSSDAFIKNKPTIPTVNNATLTLNVGGQTVSGNDAFTANDSTDTTYNVPTATASAYGVVKVSSVNSSAVTVNNESTTTGRYYPVELNSDGKAIVNVPWTDTNTHDGNDNQKVSVGTTTFGINDTVKFVAGSNVSITPDATNKTITISSTDTNTDTNTWRKVQLNGTDKLGTGTSTNPLNIKAGNNMTITESNGTFTFSATDTNTDTNQKVKAGSVTFGANDEINIVAGSNVTVTGDATNKQITIAATDTDTHYTTSLYVGATNTNSNAATSNGGTYLKLYDDSTKRAEFKITGSGATTVTSDASGNITISSTDNNTDTHYTKYLQIKGNGTEAIKYTQDSDKSLNLKPGSNVTISATTNEITINASVPTNYTADQCTTFTSDEGTCTPLAVQKGAKMFAYAGPLTGYSKASSVSSITATDTIATAISKLEKALDALPTLQDLVEDAGELRIASEDGEDYSLLNGTELCFTSDNDGRYASLSRSNLWIQNHEYEETYSQLTDTKLSFADLFNEENGDIENLTLSARELVFDYNVDGDKATLNRNSLIFSGEDGFISRLSNGSLTISSSDSDKDVTYDQDRIFIETTFDDVYDKYELNFPKESGSLLTNSCINNNTTLAFGRAVQFGSVAHMNGTMSTFKLTLPSLPNTCAFVSESSDSEYPLLFKTSTGTDTTAGKPKFNTAVTLNPSTGEITANSFWAKSDRRLKENIEEFKPQKSILDLPLVKFNFKDASKVHIGCIAQDLQEICPEIVDTNSEGYLSINESKLVYLLLDEVKKLKEEIENLKKK